MAAVPKNAAAVASKNAAALALSEIAEINLALLNAACRLAQIDALAFGKLFQLPPSEVDAIARLPTDLIHNYGKAPSCVVMFEGLEQALASAPRGFGLQGEPEGEDLTGESQKLSAAIATYCRAALNSAHRAAVALPPLLTKAFYRLELPVVEELAKTTELRLHAIRSQVTYRLTLGVVRALVDTYAREQDITPMRRQYNEIGTVARLAVLQSNLKGRN